MAFLDKKITELAFVSTPQPNDRIAIVNLGVTKQTSVDKFLQSVVAATGSFLTNATIAGNQITFTRADGTTFVRNVETASYADTASYGIFALDALSSSFATSASFAEFATSASYSLSSSYAEFATSASYAITSSYSLEALSASFADFATSASYSATASFLDAPVESASIALTASHAFASASVGGTNITLHRDSGVTAEQVVVPILSASYAITASHALNVGSTDSASYATTASYALEALSASFADFATSASFATTAAFALRVSGSATSDTASRVAFDLTQGLGIETFSYNGSVAAQVQVDTSSAHFLDPINAATASLSASASTSRDSIANAVSGAFDAVSASFSTSQTALSSSAATALTNLSSSASTARQSLSASLSTARDVLASQVSGAFAAPSASLAADITANSASAATANTNLSSSASTSRQALSGSASTARDTLASQVSGAFQSTSASLSASIADLSASNSTARENYYGSSSLLPGREEDTIRLFKGNGTVDNVTFVTRSFVKTVNGQSPNSVGNVSTTLTAVDTGTSASMLAKSSSGGFDNGEVWIISGESGSLTGSNGRAFIYDSGSGQLYELSNLSEAENDARYVLKAGDTMTGNLVLPAANPTLANEATRKGYVDLFYDSSSLDRPNAELEFHKGDNVTVDIISLAGITVSGSISASYATSASRAEQTLSSSYALTASYAISASHEIIKETTSSFADSASLALTASHAFASASVSSSNIIMHRDSGVTAEQVIVPIISASYAISASHLIGLVDDAFAQTFTGVTNFTVTHGLNTTDVIVQVYDTVTGGITQQIIPDTIEVTNANQVDLTFAVATTGYVVVSAGGYLRSGSLQNAQTASYAARVPNTLNQGLGVETFSYDGGTAGVLVQVNTSSAHFLSSSVATASFALTASYVDGNTYRENVTGGTTYTITHNLDEQYPVVQSYDTGTNRMVLPDYVESQGANQLEIAFAVAFTGIVIVQK
jgi:trimeric autotransporter adhesin